MKKIILILFLNLFFVGLSKAQSNYPSCKGNDVSNWTACFAEYTFPKNYNFKNYGNIKFFNGNLKNIYQGEWLGGLPHGKGNFYFANGFEYSGSFQYGLISGKGLMKYSKKKSYDGDWRDNEFQGYGKIISYNDNRRVQIEAIFDRGKYSYLCYEKIFDNTCKITVEDQAGNKTTALFKEIKKNDRIAKNILQKLLNK